MSTAGRKILRRFSSSISDLLSIQRKNAESGEDDDGAWPLHAAVRMGNAVLARSIIDSRLVDVDLEDSKGRTALHYAMEQSRPELAQQLLGAGAHVDAVDFVGMTPCHLAAMHGMIDAFNLLMYYKADSCAVDNAGKTPLDLACEHGRHMMVEKILSSSIPLSLLRHSGDQHTASALHLAARMGHVQIVYVLLTHGWPINGASRTRCGTPLHQAAAHGRTQVVRLLLHAGTDPSLTNAAGQTALEYAKRSAERNPITHKEIRFLLKGCRSFTYGEAVREHVGQKADELSFSRGDLIWIIERGNASDVRFRGAIFGQKGNSRCGYFDSAAVRCVERPQSVMSMSTRLPGATIGGPPRQAKKVDVPTVPASHHYVPPRQLRHDDRLHPSSARGAPSRLSDDNSTDSNGNRTLLVGGAPNAMSTSAMSSFGSTFRGSDTSTFNSMKNHQSQQPQQRCPAPVAVVVMPGTALPQGFSNGSSALPHTFTNGSSAAVCSPRNSTGSSSSHASSGFESMKGTPVTASASSSQNSFRTAATLQMVDSPPSRASLNSSSSPGSGPSSLASCSVDTLDDSGYGPAKQQQQPQHQTANGDCALSVTQMVQKGVPEAEILALWLERLGHSAYLSLFLTQGYDLASIARITPEDLTRLGVTNPTHRIKLTQEIHAWNITDSWPAQPPRGGLREWLALLGLPEYVGLFESQHYETVESLLKLNWEEFEDIGVKRLGHLKRLSLAIKKLKDAGQRKGNGYSMSQQAATQLYPPQSTHRSIDYGNHVAMPTQQRCPSQSSNTTPMLGGRQMAPHDPPPPAPASMMQRRKTDGCSNGSNGIDYISYARGCTTPGPVRAQVASSSMSSTDDPPLSASCSSASASATAAPRFLFERREPLNLHLTATSRILSDAPPLEPVYSRDPLSLSHQLMMGADCPPPPAPLSCESSMRRLKESVDYASFYGSNGSFEVPFANENCGTIKARHGAKSAREAVRASSANSLFSGDLKLPDSSLSCAPPSDSAGDLSSNSVDVLGDLGSMLQSLMNDLDAQISSAAPNGPSPAQSAGANAFPVAQ